MVHYCIHWIDLGIFTPILDLFKIALYCFLVKIMVEKWLTKIFFLFKALQIMEWDYPLRGVYLSKSIYSPEFSFVVFIPWPYLFAIFSLLCPKKDKLQDRQLRISKCWVIGGFLSCVGSYVTLKHTEVFFSVFSTFVSINHYHILIKIYRSSNKPRKDNKLLIIINRVPFSLSPKKNIFFSFSRVI